MACSGPGARRLGELCSRDDECVTGLCAAGRCLAPEDDDDGDTLTNAFEHAIGSSPVDSDTDGDGISDRDELDGALAPVDADGDGLFDVIESLIDDADEDCIPDQLDRRNEDGDDDLSVLVPLACALEGVCGERRQSLEVTCTGGVTGCVYDAIPDWQLEETRCDGLDNDCDGDTDEGADDLDGDHSADCVDPDLDGDGVANERDTCPLIADPAQTDSDADGRGDTCDPPQAPALIGTEPASPSSSRAPTVLGRADRGAQVAIHATAECAAALGDGIADAAGDFRVAIALPLSTPDGLIDLHAVASNEAGLSSACVQAVGAYLLDTLAPAPPAFVRSEPASPSTVAAPALHGAAEAGSIVALSLEPSCREALAEIATDASGRFEATLTLPENAATTIHASARDAAGNASPCSPLTTWVHDDIAPLPPSGVLTPPTPSNAPSPVLVLAGCVEPEAAVLVFASPDCSGPSLDTTGVTAVSECDAAEAYAASFAVPDNAATALSALARDAVGLESPCLDLGTYLHDSLVPAEPSLVTLTPGPIGPTTRVAVALSAEPLSAVRLFANIRCEGTPLATGAADLAGAVSFQVSVGDNALTTFAATAHDAAGNVSGCAVVGAYTHDDLAPAPPVLTEIQPGTVGSSLTVTLVGSAEAGAHLTVYATLGCTGAPFGDTSGDAEGGWQLAGLVAANTTTSFSARAEDAAGNTSDCIAFPLGYRHDDRAPPAPTGFFLPPSPASDPAPDIVVCTVAGDAVTLFEEATCGTVVAEGDAVVDATRPGVGDCAGDSGVRLIDVAVAPNATTSFWAVVTDDAGNASGCTSLGAYRHDDRAPAPPALTSLTPGPIGNRQPTLSGTGEANARLELYTGTGCAAPAIATPAVSAAGAWGVTPTVPQGTTAFHGRLRDAAGNTSGCVLLASYTYDSLAPAAPVFVSKTPSGSPSPSPTLEIAGAVASEETSEGTVVEVHRDRSDCTSTAPDERRSVTIGATTAWSVTFDLAAAPNQTSTFYARALDVAANTSACVLLTTHTHDDQPPSAPYMTSTQTAALAQQTSRFPTLEGCADADSAVALYSNASCTTLLSDTSAAAGSCGAGDTAFEGELSLPAGGTVTVYARASDAAGNTSACAQIASYSHDGTPPAAPTLTSSVRSWTNDPDEVTFTIAWTTTETDGVVRFYQATTATGCSGSPASERPVGGGAFQLTVAGDAELQLSARVVDAAGNLGACSAVAHLVGEAFFDLTDQNGAPALGLPVAIHRPDGTLFGETVSEDVGGRAIARVWAFDGVLATARATSVTTKVTHRLTTAELEPALIIYHKETDYSLQPPIDPPPTGGDLSVSTEAPPEGAATLYATSGCSETTVAAGVPQPFSLGKCLFLSPDLIVWANDAEGEPLAYSAVAGGSYGSDVAFPTWAYDWQAFDLTVENQESETLRIDASVSTFGSVYSGYTHGAANPGEVDLLAGGSLTRTGYFPPAIGVGPHFEIAVAFELGAATTLGETVIHRQEDLPSSPILVLGEDLWRAAIVLDASFAGEARPSFEVPPDPGRIADLVVLHGTWVLDSPSVETDWHMVLRGRAGMGDFRFPELPATWASVAPAGFDRLTFAHVGFLQVEAPGWDHYREIAEALETELFEPRLALRWLYGDYVLRTLDLD